MSKFIEAARSIGHAIGIGRKLEMTSEQIVRIKERFAIAGQLRRAKELLTKPDFNGTDFNQFIDIMIDSVGENTTEAYGYRSSHTIVDQRKGIAYVLYRSQQEGFDFGSIEVTLDWVLDSNPKNPKLSYAIVETLIYGTKTDFTDKDGNVFPYINYSLLRNHTQPDFESQMTFYSNLEGKHVAEVLKIDGSVEKAVTVGQARNVCSNLLDTLITRAEIIPTAPSIRVRSTLEIQIANNSRR